MKVAPLLVLAFCTALPAVAQQRPAGVTDSTIAWGKALFHGTSRGAATKGSRRRGLKTTLPQS